MKMPKAVYVVVLLVVLAAIALLAWDSIDPRVHTMF